MNNKKIIICLSLIVTAFLFNITKVYGAYFGGTPSSNGHSGGCQSGCSGSGYASCEWEKSSHTEDAGLLISIIYYKVEENKEIPIVSKYLKTNAGAWGAKDLKTIKQCTTSINRTDYPSNSAHTGKCGTTEPVDDVKRTWITVHYGTPSFSTALSKSNGELKHSIPSGIPSFSSGNLDYYIQTKLLDSLFPGTTFEQTIASINKTMGLTGSKALVEKDYVRYYIKIEPIYRIFPAVANMTKKETNVAMTTQTSDCGHGYSYTTYTDDYEAKGTDGKCPNGYTDTGAATTQPCYKQIAHPYDDGVCKVDWQLTTSNVEYGIKLDEQGNAHTSRLSNSLVTAREGGGKAYIRGLYMQESLNAHDVLDDKAQLTSGKDYYVGYTYQNAIAMGSSGVHKYSSSSNVYKLVTSSPDEYFNNNNVCAGMAIYSVLKDNTPTQPKCLTACANAGDKGSDSYLKCASNYCDTFVTFSTTRSATVAKRGCILDECQYKPPNPIDCDSDSSVSKVDYINKVSQINGGSLDGKTATSYCGFTDDTKKKSSTEIEGAYYFCERQGTDHKDSTRPSLNIYEYHASNSYINVACMERASYGFRDLSNLTLRPGQAIENYQVKLAASRDCQVFFDTNSWKLDFASTHANDKVGKMLLMNKLKGFNLLAKSTSEADTINGSEILGQVIEDPEDATNTKKTLNQVEVSGSGMIITVGQMSIKNDEAKTKVTAKVEEVVDKNISLAGMKPYGGEIELEIVNNEGNGYISKNFSSNISVDEVTLVLDYDESNRKNKSDIGSRKLNRYVYSSGIKNDYQLPRVCVKDDGSGKVELKVDEGDCQSSTNQPNYLAKRNYYTNKLAMLNRDIKKANLNLKHRFLTVAEINKNKFAETIDNSNYFKDDENCDYGIDKSKIELGITYEDEAPADVSCMSEAFGSTTAKMYRGKVDFEEGVTLKNIGIQEITGKATGNSVPNGKETLELKPKTIKISESGSEIKTEGLLRVVEAVIEDTKGRRFYEQSSRNIFNSPDNSCSITLKANTTYEITCGGSVSTVYVASTAVTNADGSLKWKKISKNDDKFTVNVFSQTEVIYVGRKSGNKLVLSAYYNNGMRCTDCRQTVGDINDNNKILDYCDKHWQTDLSNSNNSNSCYIACRKQCPISCDLGTVTSWCELNWKPEKYSSKEGCVEACYEPCVPSDDYVYRPINEYNPFPYSESSTTFGYNAGDRLIGRNWTKKEYLITDNADSNYTKNPLYEVELSISDLAAIRSNTKSYFDRNIDPYYSRKTYSKAGSCLLPDKNGYIYKGYCSALIHEGSIASKFTKVRGL